MRQMDKCLIEGFLMGLLRSGLANCVPTGRTLRETSTVSGKRTFNRLSVR